METLEYGYMKTVDIKPSTSDQAVSDDDADSADSAPDEAEQEPASPVKNEVSFTLLGFDGCPIARLVCRIKLDDTQYQRTTDADGALAPIEQKPGSTLSFNVRRDNDTYKEIANLETEPGQMNLTFVSPSFVVESKTEEHTGAPGNAETSIPKPDPIVAPETPAPVASTQPDDTAQPKPQGETPATAAHASAKDVPSKVVGKPSIKPTQAKAPRPQTSAAPAPAPKPAPGRDKNGNPLAVVTSKAGDWWGRWRMPTFNLWSWSDFSGGKKSSTALTRTVPSATAPKPNKSQLERLNTLLEIATEHTEWTITEGTAQAAAAMVNKKFQRHGDTKEKERPKGWCAKYVKIALTQAAITPMDPKGLLQFESGSEGGPALVKAGWTDITQSLPDARWAAPGDVVVYRWSDTAMQRRRESARWGGSKKTPNMALKNHGHIDIRSYDAYISDFIPSTNQPTWSDYTNIHIYRSPYYDPLPELRMRAFLRCLRDYEGQEEADDAKRYNLLYAALPGQKERRFSGFDTHPWSKIEKSQRPASTAAGAYQITVETWQERVFGISAKEQFVARQQDFFLGKGEANFTPAMQDRVAVAIIARLNTNPLADIRKGMLEDAVQKLCGKWTSLPGAKQNAHRKLPDGRAMNMAYFTELFNKYLNEFITKSDLK
jgi:muramidase (phage lysozyme)